MAKLTATEVKQAKPGDKDRKLSDGGGLFLLVAKTGGKRWRYKYRFAGKEKLLALGTYPELSLAEARKRHQDARERLAQGIDPGEMRKVEKLTRHQAAADSFEAVALEWFNTHQADKSEGHRKRMRRMLEKDLFPHLGNRPIAGITASELLTVLRRIEARGAMDIAHRAKQAAGQVFRYAVATGRAERDPSGDLKGALSPRQTKHRPAITDPSGVGRLMLAIDNYQGGPVVKAALQLSALLFLRPGEMRAMEWAEINWEAERWELAAERMKKKRPHIVPLPRQALEILRELHKLTGRGRYVFPSARGGSRPLSENGVRTALRTMGYSNDEMVPHGFRPMARTLLDEVLRYPTDWIEHQQARAVRDPTGRAYNRTSHLENRTKMMQGWADYLDSLRLEAESGNVVAATFGRQRM